MNTTTFAIILIKFVNEFLAKSSNRESLLELMALIVGAAVMCEKKAFYINAIFELDHDSQTVLKELVEHAMSSLKECGDEDAVMFPTDSNMVHEDYRGDRRYPNKTEVINTDKERSASDALYSQLVNDHNLLLNHVHQLEDDAASSKQELLTVLKQIENMKEDKSREDIRHSTETSNLSELNDSLQLSLDSMRRDLDLNSMESETIRAKMRISENKTDMLTKSRDKLEEKIRQMTDELDMDRDKGIRLIKCQNQIEKYQERLDGMNILKKTNKELSHNLELSMHRIDELETNCRGVDVLRQVIEQYKIKNSKLEEKCDLLSKCEIAEGQINVVASTTCSSQTEECDDVKVEQTKNEAVADVAGTSHEIVLDSVLNIPPDKFEEINPNKVEELNAITAEEFDTISSLKAKLKRAQRGLLIFTTKRGVENKRIEQNVETESALYACQDLLCKTQHEKDVLERNNEILKRKLVLSSSGENKTGRHWAEKALLQLEEILHEKEVNICILLHTVILQHEYSILHNIELLYSSLACTILQDEVE